MPSVVRPEISKEGELHLWGVNETQWLKGEPSPQSPVLPGEPAWLETRITPFKPSSTSSALSEEIVEVLEQLEKMGIRVLTPDDVLQYFWENPHLIELTRDLARLARERLPEAILSLEISRDPEGDEEYIVIYARFRDYDETIVRKIRDVRKEFISRLSDEREWPLLTTDFRTPEET
ncbi:MAG: hypothetical protein H5U08_12880 [Thermogutta sp.]|jgi:hypothetical protein|uniref:hypothetical protein n=1 Tax=Thermogutta sp. TaxID=1962930 RepID=UPI00180A824E|nr:hypothetical protein [Thermogutta sp.]MBC7353249.1 hypothetical protein [Thermogutta sp.]